MRASVQSGPGPGPRHPRLSLRSLPRHSALPAAASFLLALSLAACGTAATPSPSPTPTPSPTVELLPTVEPSSEPSPTVAPSATTVYVVKKGDTLIAIAKRFKITLKALQAANPQVTDPTKLQIGQKLVIPAP